MKSGFFCRPSLPGVQEGLEKVVETEKWGNLKIWRLWTTKNQNEEKRNENLERERVIQDTNPFSHQIRLGKQWTDLCCLQFAYLKF